MNTRKHLMNCGLVLIVTISLFAAPSPAEIRFKKIVIDTEFRSEGVATGDVNHDGKLDIFAGDMWYEAPGFKPRPLRDKPRSYNPSKGYSKCFANFSDDVNGDGWIDSIVIVGWNNCPAVWLENPQGKPGAWKEHLFTKSAGNETPLYGDLLGDGKSVAIFSARGKVSWYAPPRNSKKTDWDRYDVNSPKDKQAATGHTFGFGDINGDGRRDILTAKGWLEAPRDRTKSDWTFHRADFGDRSANLITHDFDGDGDADVLSSSAHAYGIWWREQIKVDGKISWKRHEIFKEFSQTHAIILADMNGDGRMDFVTGKRYYAHNGKDPGGKEPVVLYWFERSGPKKGAPKFIPHKIEGGTGVGTQFEVVDMNGDKKLDIVVSNKKGVHVFMQESGGSAVGGAKAVPLFDGKTLDGWEGNLKAFRIEDGAIVGGNLKTRIPRNEFLCTRKLYGDFELRLKCKLIGTDARPNAGIQFRSKRIPNHHEVSGYQADIGGRNNFYWGALYDESRRNKILAKPDKPTLAKAVRDNDWNDYVIRCVGPKIQLFLNGVKTVDYTEANAKIARTGIIGLQIHGGAPTEAWYKDITIKILGR
ncbi:MAG: DUF1080 domain-containing protein [Phycisphaerae bacterium]|jgi:hypothetical protein|nr:DUF1080 domain-containing protein [Phycisphaerae bacterium]